MTPELWKRVSAALNVVDSLPDKPGKQFLRQLDDSDPQVAAEVRSLKRLNADCPMLDSLQPFLLEVLLGEEAEGVELDDEDGESDQT